MSKTCWLRFAVLLLAFTPITIRAAEITGAGSVFIAPLFSSWGTLYSQHVGDISIKYQGLNSSEGIKRIEASAVDFGQTDMPLKIDVLNQKGLFQFPVTLVAFTPIVNLPGIAAGQLKLDGKTLGDIFYGKIKKWNDPAIAAMNIGTPLPNADIVVAYRKVGASGTYVLSSYIAKNNPEWNSNIGVGLTIPWPTGHGMETIKDMAAFIKETPYSIGFTEFSHVIKNGLKYVRLKNREGEFIKPSPDSIAAAARNATWAADNGFYNELTDGAGTGTWPMTSASFVLLRKVSDKPEHSREALKFFNWVLRVGQLSAIQGDFMPLPDAVSATVRSSWKGIVDQKGVPVWQ
jgi:phosphate transport system substrate-binding protein